MGDVWKGLKKIGATAAPIAGFLVGGPAGAAAAYAAVKATGGKPAFDPFAQKVQSVPGVPTIDEATQRQNESDRLLKRKGTLATIFGGASAGTPSVGKTTLGGL